MDILQELLYICKCVISGDVVAELSLFLILIHTTSMHHTNELPLILCAELFLNIDTRSHESLLMPLLTSYLYVSLITVIEVMKNLTLSFMTSDHATSQPLLGLQSNFLENHPK